MEDLMKLVKEKASTAFSDQNEFIIEKKTEVVNLVSDSVIGGLKEKLDSGDMDTLGSLFTGNVKLETHPLTKEIGEKFKAGLVSKIGLKQEQATKLSASIIPQILDTVVNKISGSVGNRETLGTMLKSLAGDSADKIDLKGLASKLSQGSGAVTNKAEEMKDAASGKAENLADSVGNMFGKK
jgi:hypothetical protein